MRIEPTSASDFFGSLAFRLLALLTIALTPIGAIAVYQTSALSEELANRSEDELLNATVKAVSDERRVFERAFGAAEALASTSQSITRDFGACQRLFERFVGERFRYSFAGVLQPDGMIRCSSTDNVVDASDYKDLAMRFRERVPYVVRTDDASISGESVIVVGHPVFSGTELLYFVVLSIPRRQIVESEEIHKKMGAFSISTYNADGDVLLTSDPVDSSIARPAGRDLAELTQEEGSVFIGVTEDGERRAFAAVPVYGRTVYAIASWDPSRLLGRAKLAAWVFPIAMWLATLAVTYVALNRLVIRHIQNLGRQMRRFAKNRALPELRVEDDQPAELLEMNKTFLSMAEEILHDEAELENALHEKNGLIREVHHRVKNNLQLIASIMNMQMRKSRNSETSNVVRRLQDRVLGLAAIHRQMYQAQSMAEIPVDQLLDEVLRQTINLDPSGRVDYTRELIPLKLPSDQAVPLSLLASEATLNAVKYLGSDKDEGPWIKIALREIESNEYELTVENSRNPEAADKNVESDAIQGLGMQLMRAFSAQIDGHLSVEETDKTYRLSLKFRAQQVENEDLSAQMPVVKDF